MTYQNGFRVASASTGSWILTSFLQVLLLVLLIAVPGAFRQAECKPQAQAPSPQGAAKQPVKKSYTLRITKEGITGVSLKADRAKLSEIAPDLAKRLGAKVILGAAMQKEAITVEFYDLTLEPALRLLAPRVYMDYEVRAGAPPTILGIYLLSNADPDPATNAVVVGTSQAMMIEGNTEDTGEPATEDDPLLVELDDNNLITIKSEKQSLLAVVMTVADVLGVPAEIKYESDEIVDTRIKDTPFEDAITRLSPNIRLYVRDDLTRSRKTALRLSLVPPTAKVASQ